MKAQHSSSSIMADDKESFAIHITGFVGRNACNTFPYAETAALNQPARELCLHLGSVEGMDGSGLQLLTVFSFRMLDRGFSLSASSTPPWLREVFHLTCLDTLLPELIDGDVVSREEMPSAAPPEGGVHGHVRLPRRA